MCGGEGSTSDRYKDCYAYDANADAWTKKSSMATARAFAAKTTVKNGAELWISGEATQKTFKGRYLNDVRKIFGILDPLPPFVTHSRNLSVVFVTYWVTPPPPSGRTSYKYRPYHFHQ